MKKGSGKNFSGIYKITNQIDGRIYVGGAFKLVSRKCAHFGRLRVDKHHCRYLQNAFNLYGEQNFIFEVIELVPNINNLSKKDFRPILLAREQYYLDTLLFANKDNSLFRDLGYNICRKADSSLGVKKTKEEVLKMSKRRLGCPPPNRQETYKISTEGKILNLYISTKEAGFKNNISKDGISCACRFEQYSSGGFIWCYKKNLDSGIISIDELVINYNKSLSFIYKGNKNSKYINCDKN